MFEDCSIRNSWFVHHNHMLLNTGGRISNSNKTSVNLCLTVEEGEIPQIPTKQFLRSQLAKTDVRWVQHNDSEFHHTAKHNIPGGFGRPLQNVSFTCSPSSSTHVTGLSLHENSSATAPSKSDVTPHYRKV